MGNFDRGGRGGGFRPRFGNRDSQRPQMHRAICNKCGKGCEVPFRPSGDKPIFCSSCFENKRGSDSRRFEGSRNTEQPESPQYIEQFAALNSKLDTILKILTPKKIAPAKKK